MKILITGGAGFVGANLAFHLKEQGHDVIVLDNLVRRGSETNIDKFKEKGIRFIHGDVRNPEDYSFIKQDIILECSAQPSATDGYNNPVYDITNNLYGVFNILEHARKTQSGIILWSTNKVFSGDKINAIPSIEKNTRYIWDNTSSYAVDGYSPVYGISEKFSVDGGQHSIYGMTKIQADIACQEYCDAFGVPTIVNRFSCLAGERQWGKCAQGWVSWFAIANILDIPIQYIGWKGKQVRDVLFIRDICSLIDLEIANINKIKGSVYTIGGGNAVTTSLIEAVSTIEALTGKKTKVVVDNTPRKADHCIYISDTRTVESAIGWKPTIGITEGYDRIIRWIYDNKETLKRMYL